MGSDQAARHQILKMGKDRQAGGAMQAWIGVPVDRLAVARSFVVGLPADVAIRVSNDGDTVVVDMRSASRYGRYDLGDNASRIVGFLAEHRTANRNHLAPQQCGSSLRTDYSPGSNSPFNKKVSTGPAGLMIRRSRTSISLRPTPAMSTK